MKNTVFEQHQIRKSKKQKSAFISLLLDFAEKKRRFSSV